MKGIGPSERVVRLYERHINTVPELDLEGAVLLTEGFQDSEGMTQMMQKAHGFRNQCEKMTIKIHEDELLVGGVSSKPRAGILSADSAWSVVEEELDTISTREYDPFLLDDEGKQMMEEVIKPYWKGRSFWEKWNQRLPEDVLKLRESGYLFCNNKPVRGFGETTPGWQRLLDIGLSGIRKTIEERLEKINLTQPGGFDERDYLEASLMSLDGIIILANRYADEAERLAGEETNPDRKKELEKIAQVCRKVPEYPAETFHEGLQSMLFYEYAIFMEQNASSYNLGRIDQYLINQYTNDIEKGNMTKEEAQELLDCMWLKIAQLSLFQDHESARFAAGYATTIQVTVGGVDKYGNDAVNDLSYQVIQATLNTKTPQPNMTAIYNMSKNPDKYLAAVAEAIKHGTGMPAVYTDHVGVQMLQNKGIPLSDAWDWNPCGCVETNLQGKARSYTDFSKINMGGMVELVFTNGKDRKTGKQVSVETGDPRKFETMDDFINALKAHLDHITQAIGKIGNLLEQITYEVRPVPALSLTYPECIENGKDYSRGGAKYNNGPGVISVGQADVINSCAAIEHCIIDNKMFTFADLADALDANFEGYDEIRQMLLDAPKYGNDIEKVDKYAGRIYNYVADKVEENQTPYGKLTLGLLPVSGNTPLGERVGALPNGRKAWEPLTDGIGPTGGTDMEGPTAVMKSVSYIPHARFTQGTQLNMKLEPKLVEGKEGTKNLMDLLKAMNSLGVYHVQFNVVDRETLLDAQKNPEKHKGLLIRVGGYTAYFVPLSKATQDEIISRTQIDTWTGTENN